MKESETEYKFHYKDRSSEKELLQNSRDIAELKRELNFLKVEASEILEKSFVSSHDYVSLTVVSNLEKQLASLREELSCESLLRRRTEQELNNAIDEINYYRTASFDEVMKLQLSEIQAQYEGIIKSLKDEINLNVESSGVEKPINPISDYFRENCTFASPNLRKMVEEFKIELGELQLLSANATRLANEWENKYLQLEEKYKGSTELNEDALKKIAELISLIETLRGERNTALEGQESALNELGQLQQVIDKLIDDSGQRTKEEVDKVRLKANENIEKLLEELHHLEKERSELAIELEYAKVNCKLPDHKNEELDFIHSDKQLDNLMKRLFKTEKQYEELKLEFETERNSKDRIISNKYDEINQLNEKNKLLTERLEYTEQQLNRTEEQLKKQNKNIIYKENQLNNLKNQFELLNEKSSYKFNLTNQTMKINDAEMKKKIESLEKLHEFNEQKWQILLEKQQKLTTQWRTEAELLAKQIEEQEKSFSCEIQNYCRKIEQLEIKISFLEKK